MGLLNTIVLFYISFSQPCSLLISEDSNEKHCSVFLSSGSRSSNKSSNKIKFI